MKMKHYTQPREQFMLEFNRLPEDQREAIRETLRTLADLKPTILTFGGGDERYRITVDDVTEEGACS